MKTKTQTSLLCPQGSVGLASGRVPKMFLAVAILAALGITTSTRAAVGHDVAAGSVIVSNDVPVTDLGTQMYLGVGVNGFDVISTNHNVSDHKLRIGDTETNDVAGGVMLMAVSQNSRHNGVSNMTHTVSGNASVAARTSYEAATEGLYFLTGAANTAAEGVASVEDNVNFAAAWFPYSTWIGGHAWSSANNGVLSNWVGSSSIVIGTHFINGITNSAVTDAERNGIYYLDLRSYGIDSRKDGVLIVNHAKNEANYALSRVNDDGNIMNGTWAIYCHDNRQNGRTYENDPVSFVFVPKSNTNVISGMFMGEGDIAIHSGATPQFEVTWHPEWSNGVYELIISGYSPETGVLIISPAGGDGNNGDNIVTYEPNAAKTGWLINSRDLPQQSLQNVGPNEAVCSFVFIPASTPAISITPKDNLLTTEAGGTAQFNVMLSGYPKPTANVTLNLSLSDSTEASLSDTALTFTPADYGVAKVVTLTGVDDAIVDGTQPYQINISATSSTDPKWNGLVTGTVYGLNNDNEASIVLDKSRVTTTEDGGTATFNISLSVAPSADVTIALSSDDITEGTVSPASLTFTALDYATPQAVTVTGVDDLVADGPLTYFIVTAAASSADPAYNGQDALNIQGENVDNDVAKVNVTALVQTVSEPGGTTLVPVVLNSQPTANVTVNFSSSDSTEATVTSSLTFTPLNWSTPQNITITAVDDFVNDGTIEYSIVTTITSTDPVYAATNPNDVPAATLDNEAALTLPSGDLTYGIGDNATGIDGYATVDDTTADYNTGSLTVSLVTAAASDRLDVRNEGTGTGQIGVSGSTVSYEGIAIGTKSGGTGTTALTVSLNAASTPVAAQALVRAVTYWNTDANVAPQTKTVTVTLADGDGGTSTASKSIVIRLLRVYTFQQGADGGFGAWTGANDCEIVHNQPSGFFPQGVGSDNTVLWLDWNEAALYYYEQNQCLLRFTNIFGTLPGQIPPGAKIVSAELTMNVTDSGHGALLNRMLLDWDPDFTSFNGIAGADGIQLDDIEAVSGLNTFFMDPGSTTTSGTGLRQIGVTADVQAWHDGAVNYGWVMSSKTNGLNGTGFTPCENTNVLIRPRLKVTWLPATVSVASFQQGVSSYSGTVDTQVRSADPNSTNNYSIQGNLSPDWTVYGSLPNPNQVLIRFDNIIGTSAGQIPAGSTIHAAVLDLTSINDAAQGAGGLFHALLRSWIGTDTWNSLGDGISTDGIEAEVTPTITLPIEGQGANVQPTRYAIELTSDVQAWASGTIPNNGWAVMPWPAGNNGWAFNTSEATLLDTRPRLRVYFEPGVVIMAPVHNGSNVQITFSGVNGRTYTVQRRGDLTTGSWSNIGTASVSGGTATFQDNAPLTGSAFYRVVYP